MMGKKHSKKIAVNAGGGGAARIFSKIANLHACLKWP